jgi:transposase
MREEGLTLEDIGKKLGTSKDSVRLWIKKYELRK